MKKTSRRTVKLNFMLVVTSITAFLSGALPSKAAYLSDPPFLLGTGKYPDVFVGPGDVIHVVWMTDSNLYYRYYNGSSWGAVEEIPLNGTGINSRSAPDIWADSDNVPHVVWGPNGGPLYYANRSGGSWSSPELIVDNPDTSLYFLRDVRIAVASDGTRHVIWRNKNLSNRIGKIYHKLWSNGSWGQETQVSEGSQTSKRCHLFLGDDDVLHVVWRQKVGPQNSYEVMYRRWVGGSFEPVIQATSTIAVAGEDPHVVTDPWNNPHISFP